MYCALDRQRSALLAALPEGVLHPRRIRSGVVAGVQDYGNKMGLPTVNGAILYDPGFTANPPGLLRLRGPGRPRAAHPRQPLPGDRVIVIGGRTGRDGLRGAHLLLDDHGRPDRGGLGRIGADRRRQSPRKSVTEVVLRARDARACIPCHHRLRGGRAFFGGGRNVQPGLGAEVELTARRV